MNKMGIWIDHKEAVMVSLDISGDRDNYKVDHIESGAENHYRQHGGYGSSSGSNVAQSVVKEETPERRRMHQYHDYYQKIIKMCDKPGHLYIFGPSEAKLEFKKELDKIKVSHITIDAVEACDKLSEHEIVNKVKSHYHIV